MSLAALLIAGSLAETAGACTPRTNLPDVEDEVMCTICGTLLAESDSPQAQGERGLIRQLIARCETKDQIKDALVAQYGRNVLATPTGHGFDLVAWIVPGLGILIALVVGGFALRRTLRRPDDGDRDAPDPSRADLDALDRDMSSYDL